MSEKDILLFVEPRKVYTWDGFRTCKPAFSVGLDGIINDTTQRDEQGPYANFDHHCRVDRISTRSTSEQIHLEINLGLFDRFRKNGIPTMNVFVNDPDEDTCLAWWLLQHHELVIHHAMPQINRLVYCEDRLDTTAGAYPFGETNMRRKMAWIFEPYNNARFKGLLPQLEESGMRNIIEAVNARITEHIMYGGKELALEGHYEKIGGGDGWTMVKETGPASRMAMYNDGIHSFIALVAEKPDHSYVYVAGRQSVWRPFPLPQLIHACNELDAQNGTPINDQNCWGGSNTIIGSPRGTGSKITHDEIEQLADRMLKQVRQYVNN